MIPLDKMIRIVATAFEGERDKGGVPYIQHCLHVMNKMPRDDEELQTIAVAHDLVEDTYWTLENLKDTGASDRQILVLDLVTHQAGMPYMEYIARLSSNPDARFIKMADLRHNSDIHRMKGLREKDFERLVKYHRAYKFLKDIE